VFTLKIKTGNAAMQTAEAVAEALVKTARAVGTGRSSGAIVDGNGNVVGQWRLTGMRSRSSDRRRR
jgi:hypothetical protein